jgi:hypothetical protein
MDMSLFEWKPIPDGLLRMSWARFATLPYQVQCLISELAEQQGYKCALCPAKRKLVVEHDHDPHHGPSDKYSLYNIRGLVCQRCNWHLMIYEKDLNGEYRGFDDVYSNVSDGEWESYIYAYDCRVTWLLEERLKEKMGVLKYWDRKLFIDKFDDWNEFGGRKRDYPWRWCFDEIKGQKRAAIRTPEQFFKALAAFGQYLKNEMAKKSDWEPPDEVLTALFRLKPFLDEVKPIVEARLLELRKDDAGLARAAP